MAPRATTAPHSAEPHAQDIELCRRVASGDAGAAQEFYIKYNRLVRFLCIRLASRIPSTATIDEADIIQEGWVLALERTRTYNGTIPFANWLWKYFDLTVRLNVDDQSYGVHLPANVIWSALRLESVNTARRLSGHPLLTDAEVEDQFDLSVKQLRAAEFAQVYLRKHLGSIDHGFSSHQDDAPSDSYDVNGHVHFTPIIGEEQQSVEEQVDATTLFALLRETLKQRLTEEERTVIALHFGLSGDDPMTLRGIDELLERGRGYASRISKIALAKLAHPAADGRGLHHFLE